MSTFSVSGNVGGREVTLSTGKYAYQADGAVTVRLGDTEVLVTATASRGLREGVDFFPLTVDVEERMYAAGRIPGSFFRREGRPTEKAILTCRLIDRPLRPTFREGFRCETHIIATVLSVDMENPHDIIALNGASAALAVSPIPFEGPIGGIRLALKDGEWIPFPTFQDLDEAVFDLTVAGGRNDSGEVDITMVEAGATDHAMALIAGGQTAPDEATVARGLDEAKEYIGVLVDLQSELASKVDIPEVEFPVVVDYSDEVMHRVAEAAGGRVGEVAAITNKQDRKEAQTVLADEITAQLLGEEPDPEEEKQMRKAFSSLVKDTMRRRVVEEGVRLDGRDPRDIRPLTSEVGIVPRAHGSGLFQRGETQVLNVSTLGMLRMEQMLDTLDIEETKRYMHHYNFPPFSTGETGFMRGPKRREIGHGALAEKALLPVIPSAEDFPYALRLVSEVLSSNGSTSMASVCASTLSLMDAGVPITEPVAGIAMGLIAHDGGFVTLTDILGAEDALGDMDFKVAGTAEVITALQLDTKIEGLPAEVLVAALDQAKEARLQILENMHKTLIGPREELNKWAPRIEAVQIPKDKIGEIIGPKGKMIRQIEEDTEATLEIEDDGTVRIAATAGESMEKAKEMVLQIAYPPEPEIGKEYEGEVVNITSFGAFVNILPGRDGLLHISKLGGGQRVDRVEDHLSLGDKIQVVVGEIDRNGKVSLDVPGSEAPPKGGGDGDDRERSRDKGGRDRGGRDRDRGGRDRDRGGRDRDRGGRSRDRGRDGDRSRKREPATQSGSGKRQVVSFEEEFEKGLD